MHHHRQTTDLSDLQPRFSKRIERVLDYVTAAAIGVGMAVLLVVQLSK